MTISSHEEFRRRLEAAIVSIDKLAVELPEREIRSIQRQLHALEEWTRDGKMATMEQRRSFSFGLLATRYVDDVDPQLGQELHHLASYVIYWDPEPAHSAVIPEKRDMPPEASDTNRARYPGSAYSTEKRDVTPEEVIVAKLDSIEAELKRIGGWQAEPLSIEAYSATKLYALDTMTRAQWLQFLLIPRFRSTLMLMDRLPPTFSLADWARTDFGGFSEPRFLEELEDRPEASNLLALLREFDALISGDELAPTPIHTTSKYGFKSTEERESEADAAKREAARPVLEAWRERMDRCLEEQAGLREQAATIAPKVEGVLREWVAVKRDTLTDHFLKVDPFVARSENGANWAVFLYDDEEAFVSYLWRVSLTQDRSEEGDPLLLLVDSARRSDEEEEEMWEILGKVTGIPVRHPHAHLSGLARMDEKSLHVAEMLRGSPHIPKRPARPAAYYRTNGEMRYNAYFVLATNWIRVEG